MATQSWAPGATVDPACAPMGPAVDVSLPTAVTFCHTLTRWCVCAALDTKVRKHTRVSLSKHRSYKCLNSGQNCLR